MICHLSDCVHNSILSLNRQNHRLPIRAAFVYDEYSGTKNLNVGTQVVDDGKEILYTARTVLGKGAIQAYLWEKKQKWIGASFDPKTACRIETDNKDVLKKLIDENFIVWHSVPTHRHVSTDKDFTDTYAINFVTKGSHVKLQKALETAESNAKNSDVKNKYKATIQFLEKCCKEKCFRPELTHL
jgi:hypothetical protein